MSAVAALMAVLRGAQIDTYDCEVGSATPPGRYVVVAERDAGRARPHRAYPTAHWTRLQIDVRCVARTHDGLRDLTSTVRGLLTGKRVRADASPLSEVEWSPVLREGQLDDERFEMLISYAIHHKTEGALRP